MTLYAISNHSKTWVGPLTDFEDAKSTARELLGEEGGTFFVEEIRSGGNVGLWSTDEDLTDEEYFDKHGVPRGFDPDRLHDERAEEGF